MIVTLWQDVCMLYVTETIVNVLSNNNWRMAFFCRRVPHSWGEVFHKAENVDMWQNKPTNLDDNDRLKGVELDPNRMETWIQGAWVYRCKEGNGKMDLMVIWKEACMCRCKDTRGKYIWVYKISSLFVYPNVANLEALLEVGGRAILRFIVGAGSMMLLK